MRQSIECLPVLLTGLTLWACGGLTGGAPGADESAAEDPASRALTFAADVAPLIARECVACHNPDSWAPFPLTSYDDVRRRADRIVEATADRYMPPWLPEAERGTFQGERHLSEAEIDLIAAWVDQGMPPGDLDALDVASVDRGWDPGEPDLVLDLPTVSLPAEGPDVYRNLVVPIPVDETRWVEYVDLLPGSRSAVHHSRMMIDTTASSRELDAEDRRPGFDGMELQSNAMNPPGHFIGWTPGKTRLEPLEGMPWRLDPGTDLVVQLHLRMSGEPQDVTAEVALHFSDEAPVRRPAVLVISSLIIDIPPGATDYSVSNSFTLPVDVEVLSIYPHAHYLGRDLQATAVLPDGREIQLIHIPRWDFNWQDDYRFAEPVSLPAGTTIRKTYTYDNSANNPNNPSDPPQRVVYGSRSDDEMADLILQVLPRNDADRRELLRAQAWQHESEDMAYMAHTESELGREALEAGDPDGALTHFREALQYRSDHVASLVGLSRAFTGVGDAQSALLVARRGVMLSGRQDPDALGALAIALAATGRTADAAAVAREALALARESEDAELIASLESLLGRLGR